MLGLDHETHDIYAISDGPIERAYVYIAGGGITFLRLVIYRSTFARSS